ncbi:unnamed protein product [Spirodela intermedia]|uniref:RCC1-like domain-containing protein n=1 Tax=Spirodela intermedia TaxID=51605 RepID=A0A7I8IDH4_SPIIN|nr:unnamed protein product [Spirodela intermedia]CAA6655671.1 unnamed protein product [Spirodela intermedia]
MEILCSGRLGAADLACLETSCRMFRGSHEIFPKKFRSVVEFVAFTLCGDQPRDLLDRCDGNWKKVLRFLQSLEQSSGTVATSSGNMQVTTGRHHTLLVHDSSVYSCGSSLCGVLGHGQDTTQCVTFTRINFPSFSHVIHVSASHNHAAFVMQSGEVFTCGDNSSFCCGHGEVGRAIFRPTRIEAMKGMPCVQAATGLSFTVLLTKDGHVYTCGTNTHGQLGHGDNLDRPTPKKVEAFEGLGRVTQIAAGSSYTLSVADDGTVFSFGSCSNFCLAHGDQHDELLPRAVQPFRRKGVHIVRVSAADEHAVALDSIGQVYTWGRGYCGALGHGDENDKTLPELLSGKRKTFVVADDGSAFAFGWMGFGSLGFAAGERGGAPAAGLLSPPLRGSDQHGPVPHLAVTTRGSIFGFGDNERAQLGLERMRGSLLPTEIPLHTQDTT